MQLTEEAKIRLVIDGKQASNELEVLGDRITELKRKQEDFEKGSKEYKEIGREVKSLTKDYEQLATRMDVNTMTVRQLTDYQRQLVRATRDLVPGTKDYIDATARLKDVNARLEQVRLDTRAVHTEVKQGEGLWTKMKGWVVGAFAVTAILEFGRQVIAAGKAVFDITAKFEGYNAVLNKMLGSQELATAAMDMIKSIASKTNWSVDALTDSFIKLNSRGLKPSSKDIMAISDVANYLKKDFKDVVEAINDINNTERWNEIGIKAKTNGDKVSLTFNGVTKEVARTEEGVLSAIVAFGEMPKVMGVTAEMSATMSGKLSNLGDAWDFVRVTLGEKLKPVFQAILDMFAWGVSAIQSFIDNAGPLGVVIDVVWASMKNLWQSMRDLFYTVFPGASKYSFDLGVAMKILGTVFMALMTPIVGIRAVIVALIDSFAVLANGAKIVGAVLKGDFEGAAKNALSFSQSIDRLKTRAVDNFGAIKTSYEKIWASETSKISSSASAWDKYVADNKARMLKELADNAATQDALTKDTEKGHGKRTKAATEAAKKQQESQEEALLGILEATTKTYDEITIFEEELAKEREERNKDWEKNVRLVQDRMVEHRAKAVIKTQNLEAGLKDRIIAFYDEVQRKQAEMLAEQERVAELRKEIIAEAVSFAGFMLGELDRNLDKQLANTTNAVERAAIETKKQWLSVGDSAISAVSQLANGNVFGAVIGGMKTLFMALNNFVEGAARKQQAKLEELRKELKAAGEEFLGFANKFTDAIDLEKIQGAYDKLFQLTQLPPIRLNVEGMGYEQRIEQELKIAQYIQDNYASAVAKEKELSEQTAGNIQSTYASKKEKEDAYHQQVLSHIQAAYDKEIQAINDKYALLDAKANEALAGETLAIREQQGQRLLALITNEEEKNAVLAEYSAKRLEIMRAYALADQEITDQTDQATIEAINKAKDARAKALLETQTALNAELTYMVGSEGQKRKELGETEKIAKEADAAVAAATMKSNAEAIEREKIKRQEIEAAEKRKNEAIEGEQQRHHDVIVALDKEKNAAIEAEAVRHNNELKRLGEEKDKALKESFDLLKAAVTAGYDEITAKALEAYQAGKITGEQYNELIAKMNQLRGLTQGGFTTPSIDWNIDWSKIPRFSSGGFIPSGPSHANGGINLYPTGSLAPIANIEGGEPILSRMTYRNNKQLVDMLLHSSVHRNGAAIMQSGNLPQQAAPTNNNERMEQLLERAATLLADIAVSNWQAANKPPLSVREVMREASSLHELDRVSSFR